MEIRFSVSSRITVSTKVFAASCRFSILLLDPIEPDMSNTIEISTFATFSSAWPLAGTVSSSTPIKRMNWVGVVVLACTVTVR